MLLEVTVSRGRNGRAAVCTPRWEAPSLPDCRALRPTFGSALHPQGTFPVVPSTWPQFPPLLLPVETALIHLRTSSPIMQQLLLSWAGDSSTQTFLSFSVTLTPSLLNHSLALISEIPHFLCGLPPAEISFSSFFPEVRKCWGFPKMSWGPSCLIYLCSSLCGFHLIQYTEIQGVLFCNPPPSSIAREYFMTLPRPLLYPGYGDTFNSQIRALCNLEVKGAIW